MVEESSNYKPVQHLADTAVSGKQETSEKIAAQVTMALSALDNRYKENIAGYAQELHSCTHMIDMARIDLDMIEKQKEPHSRELLSREKEIEYTLRLLERLTEQCVQKTVVIAELESELENLGHLGGESEAVLHSRYTELRRLEQEIGDLELTLLNHELEKQNILLKIEPVERKIDALEKKIRELESQKRYIESAYLHRLTQVTPMQPSKLPPVIEDTPKTF